MDQRHASLRDTCKEFEQDLVLYYYRECAEAERKKVEQHLDACPSCGQFLADLRRLLPLSVKKDEPLQPFWEEYSRELRRKLVAVRERAPWWKAIVAPFGPWSVPALATALVLIVALTLTLGKRLWRPQDLPPEEVGVLEILPMAENIEFFKTIDLLDSLDLLETSGDAGNGPA